MGKKIKDLFLNNFLIFFIVYYFTLFLDTTTLEIDYPIIESISKIVRYIVYLFLAIRIVLILPQYKKDIFSIKWKEKDTIIKILYVIIFLMSISIIINFITTKNKRIIFLILILIASYKTDYKKLIKTTMILQIVLTVSIVTMSITGITQDYTITRTNSNVIRHSLGFMYTTNLAQMSIFSCILYIYLLGSKIKYISLAIIQILNIVIYKITDSRTEFIMVETVIIVTIIFKLLNNVNKSEIVNKIKKVYSNIFSKTFFIFPIISFIVVMCFQFGGIWNQVNSVLSNRLKQTYENISTHGIKAFGDDIEFIGNGIKEKLKYGQYKSNYVDNEYLKMMFIEGWIFAILFIALMNMLLLILYRNKKYNELILCSIYLLFGLMNPRIVNLLYCPILFLIIPSIEDYKNIKKIEGNSVNEKVSN